MFTEFVFFYLLQKLQENSRIEFLKPGAYLDIICVSVTPYVLRQAFEVFFGRLDEKIY